MVREFMPSTEGACHSAPRRLWFVLRSAGANRFTRAQWHLCRALPCTESEQPWPNQRTKLTTGRTPPTRALTWISAPRQSLARSRRKHRHSLSIDARWRAPTHSESNLVGHPTNRSSLHLCTLSSAGKRAATQFVLQTGHVFASRVFAWLHFGEHTR